MSYYLRILILLASIVTLIYVLKKIRKAQLRIQDSLFWIFLALIFVVMGAFPELIYILTRLMGFQAPVNLVFLVIIFVLLIKVFLSSIKISQLENKLDTLVQEIAIAENLKQLGETDKSDGTDESNKTDRSNKTNMQQKE